MLKKRGRKRKTRNSKRRGRGAGANLAAEMMAKAFEKAIMADYTQSKRREFKKAYKPVKSKRTGKKPNWLTGGWYAPRKDAKPNRHEQDYGFGTW